jgi:hypothetical protein
VRKVDEGNTSNKNDPPRILISLRGEWIIAHFVAEWLVMQVMFLLEGVSASVTIENVLMVR